MHSGFNSSWTKNNLNGRVVDRVLQIMRERSPANQHPDQPFRVMVSGEHRQSPFQCRTVPHKMLRLQSVACAV